MSEEMRAALERVTRVRGVRGAILVAREDGLVVADALMEDVRGNALAALAASLAKRVGDAAMASGVGGARFLHLQATEGTLFAATAGDDLLMVAIAGPGVNVGLARLEIMRAAEAVA